MKSINVSILMSHDTGIVQHYYRPTEQDLLDDYLKDVPLLMIDADEIKLNKQIQELEQRNQNNEYIIKGKLQEKDEDIAKMKDELSSIKDQMKSFANMLGSINSNEEKQSIVKHLVNSGIYNAKKS
ncbi:MAG: hypothetical protein L0H53_03365 [Candidatus Nitrosocosmicus sp.]|nr:hypothetical protein [Candidatus Nitrosocosmicus sp.]MDN5868273.1 hypothetical protein [Candidatus Nitrosocosmicus sp.]